MASSQKVLLAYGTRYGSTRTIAREIAAFLEEQGIEPVIVDLKKTNMKNLGPMNQYSGVIVGASVAMFRVVRKAKNFLKKYHQEIKNAGIPLVYWITASTAIESPDEALEKFANPFLEKQDIRPDITIAIEPCMNMAENNGKMTKMICEGMAEDLGVEYNPGGMNDYRDKERFKKFLDSLLNLF